MNKVGIVLGVAAVAAIAGCKDPSYKNAPVPSQNEVKTAEPVAVETKTTTVETKTVTVETKPVETKPIEVKPVEFKPAPIVAPAPEYTTYIVQNGDSLSKISQRYNIRVSAIKKANGMKSDVVRVGQKLKLPGKVDIGEQKTPSKPAKVAKPFQSYSGATKEYVVKNGDTLGAIAYGNGCTIRQLKNLNQLTSDSLKIGQKLKIPADGAKATAKKSAKATKAAAPAKSVAPAKPAETKPAEATAEKKDVAAPEAAATEQKATDAAKPEEAATEQKAPDADKPVETTAATTEAAAPTTTYTVQEDDDLAGISVRWGVSAAAIRELNNLPEDAKLTKGQVLKIPAEAQQ